MERCRLHRLLRRCAPYALLLAGVCALVGCPYEDYPSMPHRDIAYGAAGGPQRCDTCHRGQPSSDNLDQQACLRCHEPIAAQIKDKGRRGYHGQLTSPRCAQCHHEHRGPTWPERLVDFSEAQQAALRPEHGRITRTGFALSGSHADLACSRCHKSLSPGRRPSFLGLSAACSTCHLGRSPHGPVQAPLLACERCHDTTAFRPAHTERGFDHSRDTGYPLRGAHAQVACASCHRATSAPPSGALSKGPVFAPTSGRARDCRSCHAEHSPHGGSFGPRLCKSCHAPERGWRARRFNHSEETTFPLDGRHADQACASCHRSKLTAPPTAACASCHGERSPHGTRFVGQGGCDTCHDTADWQDNTFDHRSRTGFPLTNLHSASTLVACAKCHRSARTSQRGFESLASLSSQPARPERPGGGLRAISCRGCHAHAQQHQDSQTAAQRTRPCLQCHAEPGSRRLSRLLALPVNKALEAADQERVSWFGHGPERPFRLVGGHALSRVKTCGACHADPSKGFGKLAKDCASCHGKTDAHGGSLKDCGRCHDPSTASWKAVPRFRHERTFPLEGSHGEARCVGCHPAGDPAKQYRGRPTLCGASECHQADDTLHRGSRGSACGSSDCHSPLHRGWRTPKFHPTTRPTEAPSRSGGNQ